MSDNYHDTVYRMYESSDILYKQKQWFNSNYLAGYVLECYCKLILLISVEQGHAFSGGHNSIKAFGHGLVELKDEIGLISLEGCAVSSYCIDVQSCCLNLINNWNPNKRYGADSSILNKDNLALDIHAEIEELMDMVIKMEVDGVLI